MPSFIRSFVWSLTSVFGGKLSLMLRYSIVLKLANNLGENVYFGTNVVLKNVSNISFGSNVSVHDFCYIDGLSGLVVGNNVSIAHSCSILTFNHTWSDPNQPIKYNPVISEKVIIEDDVWIGCGVRIMPGVTIGTRSVMAAGSVVTKSVLPGTLVAGVPARKIKDLML